MYQKFTLALYARLICAGDIAARIYQPGYLGYRGERQKIYLVLEYEYRLSLTSSSISVRLSAPQENLLWGGSGAYVREYSGAFLSLRVRVFPRAQLQGSRRYVNWIMH